MIMANFKAKFYFLIAYFLLVNSQNCLALAKENKFTLNGDFNFLLSDIKQVNRGTKKQYDATLVGAIATKFSKTYDSLEYGATASLEANSAQRPIADSLVINRAFIYSKDLQFGEMQIGNNSDVNQKIKVGPAKFARASGGINGHYLQYINSSIDKNSDQAFILIPQLPIAHGGYGYSNIVNYKDRTFGDAKNSTKINYFSPKISNWQFGVSFAPNANNILARSKSNQNSEINLNKIKNIIDIGLNYSDNFDNLGVAFSVISENAKFDNSQRNNLSAYEIATVATYFGFTFGGSYGSWNKSLQLKSDQNHSNYYTGGIAYEFGHFGASFTYFSSDFQNNRFDAKSIGIDYKIKKGFTPYIEITKFNFRSDNANGDHLQLKNDRGYVLLTGLLYHF